MAIKGVQFVGDDEKNKTGVLIDLKRHARIWKDFYDVIVAESRKDEPRVAWEQVRQLAYSAAD